RHLNDWEIPGLTKFFSTIGQFSGLKAGQDILQWQGNSKGTFKQKQWFIYLYIARSQVNYGDYSYVSKTYLGPCQGKSQKHYTVGKKQEFTLKTETTGELYLQLYGGQYGRRGTLESLRIWRIL
ncbi:hypothetical protein H5410_006445, partial [Solanum commersonii]